MRLQVALIVLCLFCVGQGRGDDKEKLFEYRGRVVHSDGRPLRHGNPRAFLNGTSFPFRAQTLVGDDGKFKFSKLRPAPYVLTIDVAGVGEMHRTIVIGPTLADSRGRIEETLEFEISKVEGSVSIRQLRIPDRALREYSKALELLGRHDVPAAKRRLLKAVEIAPDYAEVWNELGVIAYQTREFAEAEKYFRKALEQQPGFYAPLVNLGGTLLDLHKPEEALPINQQAVSLSPQDALPHVQLGLNYARLRKYAEAENHLKKAKSLDPRHFSSPQLILAEIYAAQNRVEEAVQELEEYARYHPDSPTAKRLREVQKEK
jgi:Tfp pilus assembly protein PilF